MSDFIEKSKHAEMTNAVQAHFNTPSKRTMPGIADGKSYAKGGDSKFNSVDMPFPSEGGVNYTPPGKAGHTV